MASTTSDLQHDERNDDGAPAAPAPVVMDDQEAAPDSAPVPTQQRDGSPASKTSQNGANGQDERQPLARRQSSILGSMTAAALGDEPAATSETQPLLQNQTGTREGNREQYRRNERSVARQLLERYACPLCVCVIIFIAWSIAACVFYCVGWWIWWHYAAKGPCDQPLGLWLLLQLIATTMATLSGVCPHGARIIARVLPWITITLGIYWLIMSKTCANTNPELYNFVYWYIIFLTVTYIMSVTLTIVLVSLLIYAAMNGWLGNQQGASPETITKIENFKYDPDVFGDPDNPADGRPPNECCVCSEPYSAEMPMKKTPCKHYFHTECLEKWLKVARTCPLCRLDLEDAVEDPESQPGEA